MIEVFVPRENVNDESVIILTVHVKSGTRVKSGDVVVSIETSKTNLDILAEQDGLIYHELNEGVEVEVGDLLFKVGSEFLDSQSSSCQSAPLNDLDNNLGRAKFSQQALTRAKELDVKLTNFSVGWITSCEIENFVGLKMPKKLDMGDSFPNLNYEEVIYLESPTTERTTSKRKQVESRNLQAVERRYTTSTVGIEIKVPGSRLVKPPYLFEDSISDLVVYEASRLLRKYPELNASYINEKKWVEYQQINFGWSFDNGKNLKVLAIKQSDKISLLDLQNEVERLLYLYESSESIPYDLLIESTVTFSDLSRTDASFMMPLINGRQTLILGLVKKKKNLFEIYASFDHRVSEGLTVINFLSKLKDRVLSYFFDENGNANLICYACEKTINEEIAMGRYRGFVKVVIPNGEDVSLCRNCFDGW